MVDIPARLTDVFGHFSAIGLASVVEAGVADDVMLHWTPGGALRVQTASGDLDADRAAHLVRAHAIQHAALDDWVQDVRPITLGEASKTRSPLSPRIGTPVDASEWRELATQRAALIGRLDADDLLDSRLLGGLGEPAYWRLDQRGTSRPDEGASRLEMKTRNRGEEFVQNRLGKLARAVGSREIAAISDGLTGAALLDETGTPGLDSRTPTGLRAPGPADSAAAWCALWALSCFPTRPVATMLAAPGRQIRGRGARSRTAAVVGEGRQRFTLALPVVESASTLARWRSIIRSMQLLDGLSTDADDGRAREAGRWLLDRGVTAVIGFASHIEVNDNGPDEIWLLDGVVHPLTGA